MFDDPANIVILISTFLLAGTVKGAIGLGLPTISIALLAIAFDLTTAMALLLIPSLITNLWQGLIGGHFTVLIKRFWLFLTCATVTVWLGAAAWSQFELIWLTALLGLSLLVYAGLSLSGWRPSLSLMQARWSSPLFGVANGVLTGMTGSFVVPGVLYLQALGLRRDMLVQAMGLLFALSTLALAGVLQTYDKINAEALGYSSLALIPALIGMWLGQKVRQHLSEVLFRQAFFFALALLGAYILVSIAMKL